jgi:hypothetical protein
MIVDAQVLTLAEARVKACVKADVGKGKRTRARRMSGRSGTEWLRYDADRMLGQKAEKLARMLVEKALDGDLQSVKVMVKLVEGGERQAEPKKKRSGRTAGRDYADSLWVNGEWQGEVGDEGMELWE